MRQVFPGTGEYLNAEFVFEQANLFGDARLGGKQALRCGRDIEIVVGDFPDVAQLLQLHRRHLYGVDLG